MELIKKTASIGELLFSGSFETIADGDLIVPDVKPDILKILQVNASAFISSKEISEGHLTISGRVDMTVLYICEGEDSCLQSMHTSFDFIHKTEKQAFDDSCYAIVGADVSHVDFHVINSRKISLKAIIAIDCEVMSSKEFSLLSETDEKNMQICTDATNISTICQMKDFEFLIKEQLEIPNGKSSINEILNIDYKLCDKEIKVITEKIVVKGSLSVCVLYSDIEKNIDYAEAEFPFTEVFESNDTDENCDCDIDLRICDFSFDTSEDADGDLRIIDLKAVVCAQTKTTKTQEFEFITDCYCPGWQTITACSENSYNEIVFSPSCKNTLRENVVIDKNLPQINRVYNVITRSFITNSYTEENKLSVEGKISAYILYLTDSPQSPLYSLKKDIPFSYLLESPGTKAGMDSGINLEIEHTSFHLNASNEVELRFILSIKANIFAPRTLNLINDIKLCEIPKSDKKGIVIYFVQPGDTLWKIAKNYCVSVQDIINFNDISDKNKISIGERLLIPASCSCV